MMAKTTGSLGDQLIGRGLRGVLRGQITLRQAALELARRARVVSNHRRERGMLDELATQEPGLHPEFQQLSSSALLTHFRQRTRPKFLAGFEAARESIASWHPKLFPEQSSSLIKSAQLIVQHQWPLFGFGKKDFGKMLNWRRDPFSGRVWPLSYHADISLWHNDGSDIRALWELNRLGHLITLGQAFVLTEDEQFAEEFFAQVDSWREQNPVGRGPNWSCAMEVALRAINLLAAFTLFRHSQALTEHSLLKMLQMFYQHGAHIERNLEFSFIATSNHYLTDVAGLLWLGITLPELGAANKWREWGARELLREMDKQVLADGAHYEASTGYHRFVTELFLYSLILCKANEIPIGDEYWHKLHSMLRYIRNIMRPDGFAPLVGDSDGSRVLPIVNRRADDHAYLVALGAVIFNDSSLKLSKPAVPEELLWVLADTGPQEYQEIKAADTTVRSRAFPQAGIYIMRQDDLFLLLSASKAVGIGGRSHAHNDALSIEVSACDRSFIVDPGSYVYTADLRERQLFRSTEYHSTVQIAEAEQNTTSEHLPFCIGNEAQPQIIEWQTTTEHDVVIGEHSGYERLSPPVKHRRRVIFQKRNRWWLVEDELIGTGEQSIAVRFHFDTDLELTVWDENIAVACDKITGSRLLVCPLDLKLQPEFVSQFASRYYGAKSPSISACWFTTTVLPRKLSWALLPVCADQDENERLRLVRGSGPGLGVGQ